MNNSRRSRFTCVREQKTPCARYLSNQWSREIIEFYWRNEVEEKKKITKTKKQNRNGKTERTHTHTVDESKKTQKQAKFGRRHEYDTSRLRVTISNLWAKNAKTQHCAVCVCLCVGCWVPGCFYISHCYAHKYPNPYGLFGTTNSSALFAFDTGSVAKHSDPLQSNPYECEANLLISVVSANNFFIRLRAGLWLPLQSIFRPPRTRRYYSLCGHRQL